MALWIVKTGKVKLELKKYIVVKNKKYVYGMSLTIHNFVYGTVYLTPALPSFSISCISSDENIQVFATLIYYCNVSY